MPFTLKSLTSVESVIRTGLPQVISAMVKNLLLISTTNLSPYLIMEGSGGGAARNNSNQTHHFNTTSVVWFGYVNMAIVPIGGIVSGFVTNAIGTKFSLQGALGILIFLRLISIFFKEAWQFYTIVILTNFCSEFFKGPVFAHLAESAEPHLRTTLSASASSSMVFGQFQQLLMSTFLNPKITTYINCALPCICIFLLIIVPETPPALLLKNKLEEARKSLAWYRGWVKVEVVEPEFQELLAYHREEEMKKQEEEKSDDKESDGVIDVPNSDKEQPSTSFDLKTDIPDKSLNSITDQSSRLNILKGAVAGQSGRLSELKKITASESSPLKVFKKVTTGATNQLSLLKGAVTSESSLLSTVKDKVPIHLLGEGLNTLKNVRKFTKQSFVLPLALVTFTYFLVYFTGTTVLLSQPDKILHTLQAPLNARYAAVILAGANVVGSSINVMVIKVCGKRLIVFISLIGMTVCSVAVSLYAYITDVNYNGNNHNMTESITAFATIPSLNAYNWIPLVILLILCVISNFGLCNLPWVLVGELFSKNTRAVGTGIASGITSLLDSFCNASLGTLLTILGFSGLYGFYAGVSVAGVIILHFIVPETEGKSLDEIEKHFDELSLFSTNIISRYFNAFVSIFRRKNIKCLEDSNSNKEKEKLASENNKNNINYGSL